MILRSLRVSSERNSPYSTPVRQSHSEKTPVLKVKVSDDDSTKKQVRLRAVTKRCSD